MSNNKTEAFKSFEDILMLLSINRINKIVVDNTTLNSIDTITNGIANTNR